MQLASVGHGVFAAVMIGFGILGLIDGDFVAIWQAVPDGVPARPVLAFFCASVSLTSGIGLLWQRSAAPAARLLFGVLLLWMLLFRLPGVLLTPTAQEPWSGWGETAVMVAGAWVLYAWFATDWDRQHFRFATGDRGVRIARALYGLALIPFGMGHFVYIGETTALVPDWLPWHPFFAYLTGLAFLAAGVTVLTGVYARLAAALSTSQMGLFTLLVWAPIVMTGSADAYQWSETLISAALTAGGWVVTDSYRGRRWLALRQR